MSETNRIIWSEGLFPAGLSISSSRSAIWKRCSKGGRARCGRMPGGFAELEIERDLLAIGKVGLRRARGVFPDGTPFSMPDNDPLPPPLTIGPEIRSR